MAWDNITLGDYGFEGRLTLTQDGTAQDISSYTTRQFLFVSPAGTSVTKTATFLTDGADGILKYIFQDGDISDAGVWTVSAQISKTGVRLTSSHHIFHVEIQ